MRRRLIVAIVTLPMLGLSMPRAVAADPLVVGLWPQTLTQLHEIEAASGLSLPYFRGRQRDGQFDSQLVPPDAAAAAAAGYSLGLNIQPKTGSGQNRTGIRYTDITAQLQAGSGPYYDTLVGFANEVLALPTYGEVTHYLQFHSEANVQAAPGELDSQPYSGTGPEYRVCFELVRALFDSMGVTARIEWQVVLTRGAYDGNHGGPTNWFPDDPDLYDLVGVDGYYRPNAWLMPEESFDSALAFAASVGKQAWIDETGADEGGPTGSATAKAAWFAALGTYLQAHAGELAGVVFSHAKDGGNWFLDSVSGGRASPNYTGTTWNGWRTLATAIASPPAPTMRTLTVSPSGDGIGTIAGDVGGIDCGTTCSALVEEGTEVVLTATPEPGSMFTGWSGTGVGCGGTGPCVVSVDADTTVVATFARTADLSVVKAGAGGGSVSSSPAGIACGPVCSAAFVTGSQVVLTATPDLGSTVAWSGPCVVSEADPSVCTVTMQGATSVGATFEPVQHALAVTAAGPGTGTVTSAPAGIDCGSTCDGSFTHGTEIVLTATSGPNSDFSGWSDPACPGTGDCTLVLDGPRQITATFDLAPRALSVSTAGSGTGSITSEPAGIDCGATCDASFGHGTEVTLTAVAGEHSTFTGWSGACSGPGPCTVTMLETTSVVATFALDTHMLTVSASGTGTGSVTSVPAAIACGAACASSFDHGTQVVLTATADEGMVFSGWSDPACPGTGDCTLVLDGPRQITATFDLAPVPLTVADADPSVTWNGWRGVIDPAASGGAYRTNAVKGETLTWVSPATTSISWIARTGPALGRATVVIDGSGKGSVDLYSPVPGSITKTYDGLASETHTVVIKVAGSKSAASTGTTITHDAFVAGAATTQESEPGVRYVSWRSTSQGAATDGTYRSTSTRNATVTVTFSGTALEWITATGRTYGKASVTIDGVSMGTVDLYASSTTWQVKRAFGGLSPGVHIAVIKVLGTKNAAATGTEVVVDAFVVHP